MFSEIDKTIFPDSCEVLEIVPLQHYVFPIFKCGKSSLYDSIHLKNWKIISNDEISKISAPITVFLRNPKSRFVSGVNTYLQHIKRSLPHLDDATVLWFVDNYLFLNRHYTPQFFWLMNLAKYTGPDVKLKLRSYLDISKLTHINSNADVSPPSQDFLKHIEKFNWNRLELYFYLDQHLTDRIGQEFTLRELIDIVKQCPDLYQTIFAPAEKFVKNVLSSP